MIIQNWIFQLLLLLALSVIALPAGIEARMIEIGMGYSLNVPDTIQLLSREKRGHITSSKFQMNDLEFSIFSGVRPAIRYDKDLLSVDILGTYEYPVFIYRLKKSQDDESNYDVSIFLTISHPEYQAPVIIQMTAKGISEEMEGSLLAILDRVNVQDINTCDE